MPEKQLPKHSIGNYSYGPGVTLNYAPGVDDSELHISTFCSFASGVKVMLGGEHHVDWVTTFPFHDPVWGREKEKAVAWGRGDVQIGNAVWVGTDTLILSGSMIGDGAVVGARTVVSGTVAPFSLVAGNPMRFVKWLFDEPTRVALQAIAWWSWPDERIKRAVPYLQSPNVQKFIDAVNRGEL